jgi:hypothetical protein
MTLFVRTYDMHLLFYGRFNERYSFFVLCGKHLVKND